MCTDYAAVKAVSTFVFYCVKTIGIKRIIHEQVVMIGMIFIKRLVEVGLNGGFIKLRVPYGKLIHVSVC